jgi:hypothetical protein
MIPWKPKRAIFYEPASDPNSLWLSARRGKPKKHASFAGHGNAGGIRVRRHDGGDDFHASRARDVCGPSARRRQSQAPAMKRSLTLRKRREAERVFDFTKWGFVVQIAGADRFPGNGAAVICGGPVDSFRVSCDSDPKIARRFHDFRTYSTAACTAVVSGVTPV